ncbi:hypothetical protein LCGC14_0383060 [marine sediment metagenome]|uniref:Major capsid protein n=1 Tax=marine sediment metagenome TaxID=412755 RepID=A0A0F9TJR2_9ZZZZ
MAGEFTLVELSKIETDPGRKSVIDTLLMESDIMQIVPWETIGALSTNVIRMGTLPSVGFRKVNAGFSVGTSALEQKVENISLMGAFFDVDKAIVRAKNTSVNPRAINQVMMTKAMAYKFNDKFINGNPESDPEEFKGLEQRVDDVVTEGFTGQSIDVAGGSTTEGILNSSAISLNFLNKFDQAMYQIKGHNPDFAIMNSNTLLAIRAILRKEKLLDTTKDFFDRTIDVYGNTRLIDIGVTADQTTEILAEDETKGGGTAEVSIYFIKFAIGEFFWGIQEYPLEVDDKGLLEDKPIYRTEVDWPLGLAMADQYSIARLYGVIPTNAS